MKIQVVKSAFCTKPKWHKDNKCENCEWFAYYWRLVLKLNFCPPPIKYPGHLSVGIDTLTQ